MNCQKELSIKITSSLPTPKLWWKMEEAAASNRIDQVVGAVLSQANSPAQSPGKINNCAQFNPGPGSSDGLVGVGLSWPYAGNGFTVAGWFIYQNLAVNTQLMFKVGGGAFFAGIETKTTDASFHLNAAVGGDQSFADPPVGVWNFLVLEFSGGNLNLEFNRNGTIITTNSPAPAIGQHMTFFFSCSNGALGNLIWSVDEVGMFDGILTSEQKNALFNNNNGVTYPY